MTGVAPRPPVTLVRGLGLFAATALVIADVIGTVVWLGVHFSLGYALGSSVDALGGTHDLLLIVAGVSIACVVGALALHWLWRRRATRAAVRARV